MIALLKRVRSLLLYALVLVRTGLFLTVVLLGILMFQGEEASALQDNLLSTGSVQEEGAAKITFTLDHRRYEYSLEDLGLEIVEGLLPNGMELPMLYCKDPTYLSYKLYQLSLIVQEPPVDAEIIIDERGDLKILPEKEGREVDLGELITNLGNRRVYNEMYPLPMKKKLPQVTTEDLQIRLPNSLWAEYTTILADIKDRTENVRLASSHLDRLFIAPGQEVSFNEVVGPREKDRGFREAKIIVAGNFEPGLGGGICQVSSTLYNTVLLSGLEIIERHNHSVRIAYVPLGRDATVVYGHKDFKFRNNTEKYLLLRSNLSGLKLTISLYGPGERPSSNVELKSRVIKSYPYSTVFVVDRSLKDGGQKTLLQGQQGYLVESFRLMERDEKAVNELLSRDYYSPQNRLIAVKESLAAERKESGIN